MIYFVRIMTIAQKITLQYLLSQQDVISEQGGAKI